MGIFRYFYYIYKNYPQCIHKVKDDQHFYCDHLLLDVNCLLHPLYTSMFEQPKNETRSFLLEELDGDLNKTKEIPKEKNYNAYYQSVIDSIISLCNKCNPKYTLGIFIDGTAPISKMSQQRQRRYLSDPNNNRNEITAGTEMMYNLAIYIENYIKNHKEKFIAKNIIFSSNFVPGEGEQKIIRYISNNKLKGKIIIKSEDADVILLSVGLKRDDQTLIYRTNMFTDSLDYINGFKNYFLNVNIFVNQLLQIISSDKLDDFVCVSSILGNDFIHHIETISILNDGFNELLLALATLDEKIIVDNNINYKGLLSFFKLLSSKEQKFLDKRITLKSPSMLMLEFPKINDFRREFNLHHFHNIDIHDVCFEYIKALVFVSKYYLIDLPSWHWEYPFNYSPLLTDIYEYLKTIDNIDIKFKLYKPLSPFEQLLCVLPKHSYKLLPLCLQELMTNDDSVLCDFYLDSFRTDSEGKIQDYEKIVLLNKIDVNRIKSVFKEYNKKLNRNEKMRNKKHKIIIV